MRRRIVISPDYDHFTGRFPVKRRDEVEILPNCRLRWVGGIKNVSGDDQDVDGELLDRAQQGGEKRGVFFRAGKIAKRLSQMPISGVERAIGIW